LGLTPIVGQVKAIIEVFTGRNLITGEEQDRSMTLLSFVPMGKVAGKSSKYISKGKKVSEKVFEFKNYDEARNATLEWLEKREFKAEMRNISKMRLDPNIDKAIGMKSSNGTGFRVEYGEVNGIMKAHINVFTREEKGIHFVFEGDQKTVNQIIKRFNR
jgi:hypothetical protein